jgi:hypothetical protein
MAGNLSDRKMITEFEIVEKLLKLIKDRSRTPRERTESMLALTSLAEKQIAKPIEVLDIIYKLVRSSKEPLVVRIDALNVMGSLGNIKANLLEDKEFVNKVKRKVEDIAEKATNPTSLRCNAYIVLGAMGPSRAADTFTKAIRVEKKRSIKEAAMEGLLNYVESKQIDSQSVMNDIVTMVKKMDSGRERQLRTYGILVIEQLIANGAKPINEKSLIRFLIDRMEKGRDHEMIAASQCLLRIEDPGIVRAYLGELKKERGPLAQLALIKGVIELFRPLSMTVSDRRSSNSDKSEAISNANKIIEEVLVPLAHAETAPLGIRQTAIMGLGSIPQEFSRKKAAKALVALLPKVIDPEKKDDDTTLPDEIEASLMLISRRDKPFREIDGTIQIDNWEKWIDRNEKYLDAGKAPWEKDD